MHFVEQGALEHAIADRLNLDRKGHRAKSDPTSTKDWMNFTAYRRFTSLGSGFVSTYIKDSSCTAGVSAASEAEAMRIIDGLQDLALSLDVSHIDISPLSRHALPGFWALQHYTGWSLPQEKEWHMVVEEQPRTPGRYAIAANPLTASTVRDIMRQRFHGQRLGSVFEGSWDRDDTGYRVDVTCTFDRGRTAVGGLDLAYVSEQRALGARIAAPTERFLSSGLAAIGQITEQLAATETPLREVCVALTDDTARYASIGLAKEFGFERRSMTDLHKSYQ